MVFRLCVASSRVCSRKAGDLEQADASGDGSITADTHDTLKALPEAIRSVRGAEGFEGERHERRIRGTGFRVAAEHLEEDETEEGSGRERA